MHWAFPGAAPARSLHARHGRQQDRRVTARSRRTSTRSARPDIVRAGGDCVLPDATDPATGQRQDQHRLPAARRGGWFWNVRQGTGRRSRTSRGALTPGTTRPDLRADIWNPNFAGLSERRGRCARAVGVLAYDLGGGIPKPAALPHRRRGADYDWTRHLPQLPPSTKGANTWGDLNEAVRGYGDCRTRSLGAAQSMQATADIASSGSAAARDACRISPRRRVAAGDVGHEGGHRRVNHDIRNPGSASRRTPTRASTGRRTRSSPTTTCSPQRGARRAA